MDELNKENKHPFLNQFSGSGRTNGWDSQNRLVSCTSGGQTSYFSYGADGLRRTSQVGSGPETQYVLDGQAVVRERCENSNIATYFTSARGIEYRRDDTADDPGNPSRHVVRWYLYDGLGSVIAEVGENVFMEADNTPCVPVLGVNRLDVYGNDLGGSSGTSSHKFVGKLGHTTDGNTGLIYMRARYYDPSLGRFISEDPARDGVNWYIYCENNPVNIIDVDGQMPQVVLAAVICLIALAIVLFMDFYYSVSGEKDPRGRYDDETDGEWSTNRQERRHGISPPGYGPFVVPGSRGGRGRIMGQPTNIKDALQCVADAFAIVIDLATDIALR